MAEAQGRWRANDRSHVELDDGRIKKVYQVTDSLERARAEAPEADFVVSGELDNKNKIKNIRLASEAPSELQVAVASAMPTELRPGRYPVEDDQRESFFNPYNWIPTGQRPASGPLADLGDQLLEVDGSRLRNDRISGTLKLTVTAETPLLFPDAKTTINDESKHLSVFTREEHPTANIGSLGRSPALLPITSFKGAMVSMLEAATNSRFSVFEGHDKRLGYRSPASGSANLVPVRLTLVGGELRAELLTGFRNSTRPATGTDVEQYAAWLGPAYDRYPSNALDAAIGGQLARHGSSMTVALQLCQHKRFDRRTQQYVDDFRIWVDTSALQPSNKLAIVPNTPIKTVTGWVFATGKTIDKKHHEKLFFNNVASTLTPVRLGPRVQETWDRLIEEQREQNADALKARDGTEHHYTGQNPRETSLSPHLWKDDRSVLAPGLLAWAAMNSNGTVVDQLHPVQISRQIFEHAPVEFLNDGHKPASQISELSPADRIRGWVAPANPPGGPAAIRGRAWVESTASTSLNSVEVLTTPVIFPILATPKPNNGGFYVGSRRESGKWAWAQTDSQGRSKRGYDSHNFSGTPNRPLLNNSVKQLRRKTFPHHSDPVAESNAYWDVNGSPAVDFWRRFASLTDEQIEQNRTVRSWVRPGATFSVTIRLENLSRFEVGAIAWLCSFEGSRFWKLGAAKPLGLGSASVQVDASTTQIYTTVAFQESLKAWPPLPALLDAADLKGCIDAFKAGMTATYGSSFFSIPCIAALLKSAEGQGAMPTHYPYAYKSGRDQDPLRPPAMGLNYEWWVANDKVVRREVNDRSLPDLVEGPGLPIFDVS
jgi:CRISPR-associated protein (TIGR03986 family)